MADSGVGRGLTGTRARVLVGLGLGAAVLVAGGGAWTMAWSDGLREANQLLPGTRIAGVEVGGATVEEAQSAVRDVVEARLDHPVVVTAGGRGWSATARELGATSDLAQVVDTAWDRTRDASLVDLARLRLGLGGLSGLEVTVDVPDAAVTNWVREMAADVDVAPLSATIAWADGSAEVRDGVVGRAVLRSEAVEAIEAAFQNGLATLPLPIEDRPPSFTTEQAHDVAGDVQRRVDVALDRVVTITLEDTARRVTARELGAVTNAPRLLASRGEGVVELRVAEEAAHAVVDEVVEPHEVGAVDATLRWTREAGFSSSPGATGLKIDHQATTAALVDAVVTGREHLDLSLQVTQPDVTQADFDEVLLVRQAERQVDLVQHGTVVRTWDVAVGTSGYPTPTGQFTIGAKRFEPTWHNPDPTDWGRDMPAVIGPGPGNPLGLRALNWHRDGVDTLIRFHGTQNASSIGRAASHGCVRMTNPDVIELYDLVENGTVILSVA